MFHFKKGKFYPDFSMIDGAMLRSHSLKFGCNESHPAFIWWTVHNILWNCSHYWHNGMFNSSLTLNFEEYLSSLKSKKGTIFHSCLPSFLHTRSSFSTPRHLYDKSEPHRCHTGPEWIFLVQKLYLPIKCYVIRVCIILE